MPWKKIEDAPNNIRELDDVKLTLTQINEIADIADSLDKDKVENVWAVAISTWKKAHEIEGDKWIKKEGDNGDNGGEHAALEPNTTDPDMLCDINEVEIFRVGKWTDGSGKTREWKIEDLEDMVKNQREDGCPLRIGHPAEENQAAVGWVENLRIKADGLYCDFRRVLRWVADSMKSEYRKRSAGIYKGKSGWELNHVALLGAVNSALPLSDVFASYAYAYKVDENNAIINFESNGGETMDDKLEKELRDKIAKLESEIAEYKQTAEAQTVEFATKDKSATDERDALKADIEKAKSEIAERDGKLAEYAKAADEVEIAEFGKSLAKKLTPAAAKSQVKVFAKADADGRKEMVAEVVAMSENVLLSEQTPGGGGETKPEPDGYDAVKAQIDAKGKELGIDINTAEGFAQAAMKVLEYAKPPVSRDGDDSDAAE